MIFALTDIRSLHFTQAEWLLIKKSYFAMACRAFTFKSARVSYVNTAKKVLDIMLYTYPLWLTVVLFRSLQYTTTDLV